MEKVRIVGIRKRIDIMQVLQLQKGIIYGPVKSRRLGPSLGINLLPTNKKYCSYNCIYCHYGFTDVHTLELKTEINHLPTPDEVKQALEDYLSKDKKINYITFSGNGEPTLHPQFPEMVDVVKKVRDKYVPEVKVAILSNSSTVDRPEIRKALDKLDVRIMKLDCGTEKTWRLLNNPYKSLSYQKMVDNLKQMKEIIVQTIFLQGRVDNTKDEEVAEWISKLKEIKPKEVQIYTCDRPVPDKGIEKVPKEVMQRIAEKAEKETKISVRVF
jgi:wyosine [tRNA(Phe)-imidazoG37] synthetase (radical SAM superfamily)